MSDILTTGLALEKVHPIFPHHLNAAVTMILVIIVLVTTTSTTTIILGTFLVVIAASFISSFSFTLLRMCFSVACNFDLIASFLTIGKQMRLSTIKALGRMIKLPCSMMSTRNVPGVGGIYGVVGVVGQNEDLINLFQRSGGSIYQRHRCRHLVDLLLIGQQIE